MSAAKVLEFEELQRITGYTRALTWSERSAEKGFKSSSAVGDRGQPSIW